MYTPSTMDLIFQRFKMLELQFNVQYAGIFAQNNMNFGGGTGGNNQSMGMPAFNPNTNMNTNSTNNNNAAVQNNEQNTTNNNVNSNSNTNEENQQLTPENKKKLLNGTYPGNSVKINGITHYRYADCPANKLKSVQGHQLRQEAADAFVRMQEAARRDGVNLKVVSGYRSSQYQINTFKKGLANKTNPSDADITKRMKVSAPSGFSEHHTGLAIDINSLNENFANTKAYKWLKAHASEYGFEMSFPKGNAQGLNFEPWHWRYVGTPETKAIFSQARS